MAPMSQFIQRLANYIANEVQPMKDVDEDVGERVTAVENVMERIRNKLINLESDTKVTFDKLASEVKAKIKLFSPAHTEETEPRYSLCCACEDGNIKYCSCCTC